VKSAVQSRCMGLTLGSAGEGQFSRLRIFRQRRESRAGSRPMELDSVLVALLADSRAIAVRKSRGLRLSAKWLAGLISIPALDLRHDRFSQEACCDAGIGRCEHHLR